MAQNGHVRALLNTSKINLVMAIIKMGKVHRLVENADKEGLRAGR